MSGRLPMYQNALSARFMHRAFKEQTRASSLLNHIFACARALNKGNYGNAKRKKNVSKPRIFFIAMPSLYAYMFVIYSRSIHNHKSHCGSIDRLNHLRVYKPCRRRRRRRHPIERCVTKTLNLLLLRASLALYKSSLYVYSIYSKNNPYIIGTFTRVWRGRISRTLSSHPLNEKLDKFTKRFLLCAKECAPEHENFKDI